MTTASMEMAILQVIEYMHDRLDQDLTTDDLARTARFSKFHFSRMFREVTGTSPGRFLSALRIQEAKCLLVGTDRSVADISAQVGYSSVGTFSSRFKECVGLSPSRFRELDGDFTSLSTQPSSASGSGAASSLSVQGRVVLPADRPLGQVFVGLFASPIPQGSPGQCTIMDGPGPFELHDVRPGTWHLMAASVPYGSPSALAGRGRGAPENLSVGRYGPITVRPGVLLMPADIVLRPASLLDPPVLIAVPGSSADIVAGTASRRHVPAAIGARMPQPSAAGL
ncbi:AraC family transcriptional regulator [Streptomyces sp. A1277]|uniref:helix-turn-helix domain-containing protein n=1 Tax=Streptomyces sp. A1277 TaxID=2563103 RepID=UPI0010A233E0|nr:AraC family transcriptional regulator [Streptomyces sp. A1277]THA34046.1 AraC family transcriptional regulator [Streptomyces sp. A1277]